MLTYQKESRQARRNRERQELQIKEKEEKIEFQCANKIKSLFKTVLSEKALHAISVEVKLQKRQRKLSTMGIVAVLMMGCSNNSNDVPVAALETMCLYLGKWFGIYLKPQSLQHQINRKETAMFIKKVMINVMNYETSKVLSKLLKKEKKQISTLIVF